VFVNLIQNAMDATAGRPGPRIVIDTCTVGDVVEIVVADNGPGVDPAIVEKLFLPFHTTKPDGLGLGLAICCDMVADWGGELRHEARSEGAAFVVRLVRA
jgi:two-component system, NtrC family, C4-dicarboxylate transport sensor histidine kinase DctB